MSCPTALNLAPEKDASSLFDVYWASLHSTDINPYGGRIMPASQSSQKMRPVGPRVVLRAMPSRPRPGQGI